VKQTSDITHVWGTLNPAATDKTPKDTAYTAVATPIESAFLKMGSFDMRGHCLAISRAHGCEFALVTG